MRLIPYSFSANQNVLPFVGLEVDTLWSYYATRDRLSFSEYKGHWPDFIIQEAVVPNREATEMFGERVKALFTRIFGNEEQSRTLAELRDTLLPKLLSGEVRVREAEKILERIPYEGF
jgi:type I restriction enzyme S subunit